MWIKVVRNLIPRQGKGDEMEGEDARDLRYVYEESGSALDVSYVLLLLLKAGAVICSNSHLF